MEVDKINLSSVLIDTNSQIASFRDMLIHIGHSKHDSPELRVMIRKTRRACVESCVKVAKAILSQFKSSSEITATPILDNPHLILLFYLTQLFLRELIRSYHLLKIIPMENMQNYFDSSAVGPSNLGNVISQLLLCKQINPDFHSEELCSITKDSQEIAKLLAEMQEYMPIQDLYLEQSEALRDKNSGPWLAKGRMGPSLYRNMGLFCCISRQHPNYV